MPSRSEKRRLRRKNPNLTPVLLSSDDDSLHVPPPLPTLPFDLIPEILCRLPVKLLLQLQCVCKSWNSLIADPKFAKKHLRLSTTCSLHCVSYNHPFDMIFKSCQFDKVLNSYPLDSIFTNIITNVTKFNYSLNNFKLDFHSLIGSCNGILCIASGNNDLVILWNPSIRKVKELPLFERPQDIPIQMTTLGFGYDSFTDNYKVIIVFRCLIRESSGNFVNKTKVKVHTLGTDFWKIIPEFPFGGVPIERTGKFVSGTINWLTSIEFYKESPYFIVSYDLGKESYQEVLLPDCRGVDACHLILGVLRDCLCILAGHDVWIMNEYGNKESWTKLFTLSYMCDPSKYHTNYYTKVIYIFEDDQVLLKPKNGWEKKLVLYNSRNGTFEFTNFSPIAEVCVESLISPCF